MLVDHAQCIMYYNWYIVVVWLYNTAILSVSALLTNIRYLITVTIVKKLVITNIQK